LYTNLDRVRIWCTVYGLVHSSLFHSNCNLFQGQRIQGQDEGPKPQGQCLGQRIPRPRPRPRNLALRPRPRPRINIPDLGSYPQGAHPQKCGVRLRRCENQCRLSSGDVTLLQTLMAARNLFIGDSSSSVNTPVISMAVNSCGSKGRRRRSAGTLGVSTGTTTAVDINIARPSRPIAVNETVPPDSDGIVTSLFNLTSPGSLPILLRMSRPN